MMSIYHKSTKLSTPLNPPEAERSNLTGSISIISLSVLVFSFLFPHTALANNIGKSNILSFNFLETTGLLPFVLEENSIFLTKSVNEDGKTEEGYKILMLPVEPVIEEDNDKIAEKICKEAGIDADLPCWQDLKAMRQKESFDGKQMTGDGGRSRGWYHIQIKLHRISDECALDFKCSTEWTVKNLITNGYKTNRFYAISRHNGGGIMAQKYARSVVYNSAKFEQ